MATTSVTPVVVGGIWWFSRVPSAKLLMVIAWEPEGRTVSQQWSPLKLMMLFGWHIGPWISIGAVTSRFFTPPGPTVCASSSPSERGPTIPTEPEALKARQEETANDSHFATDLFTVNQNSNVLLQLTISLCVQGYWRDVIIAERLSWAQAGRQWRRWLLDLRAHTHRWWPGQQRLCGGATAVCSQAVCKITDNAFVVSVHVTVQRIVVPI